MKLQYFILMLSLILSAELIGGKCNALNDIINNSQEVEERGQKEAIEFLNTLKKSPQNQCGDLTMKKYTLYNNSIHRNTKNSQSTTIPYVNDSNYNDKMKQNDMLASEHEVLIFVSFSLGSATLKKLYKDVKKIGGRLILRGLYKDSLLLTQQKIQSLRIGIDIDPPLFEQFNVQEVPTFILTEPYQHNKPFQYDQLKGNVTLEFALEKFAEEGEHKDAKIFLKKLNRRHHA